MPKHLFSSTDQPEHKGGRKPLNESEKVIQMQVCLTAEEKAWYIRHRGLARKVLQNFRKLYMEESGDR